MTDVEDAQTISGQDPKHAHQHQAAGGAKKSANDRKRNKSDRPAQTRQAETAKQKAGQSRTQRQYGQGRHQQAQRCAVCAKSDRKRADEGCDNRAGRAVGAGDRKGQRAAQGRYRPTDRTGDECRRETVGKPRRKRPRENQGRIGHVEQD